MIIDDRKWQIPPDFSRNDDQVFPQSKMPKLWHIDLAVLKPIWDMGIDGRGVNVAVCDTGYNNHPDLPKPISIRNFSNSNNSSDGNGHGCISPTDEIYTSNCGLQQIQTFYDRMSGVTYNFDNGNVIKDISRYNINTFSLNCESGRPTIERKQITHVHKLHHRGDLIIIKVNNQELSLTPWHPVYVMTSCRGKNKSIIKKRADQLQLDDKVCIVPNNDINISDDYINVIAEQSPRSSEFKSHVLTPELAYFAGLIFTDGHLRKLSNDIEFSSKDLELIKIFKNCANKLFGLDLRHKQNTSKTCYRIKFSNIEIYRILNLIGIQIGNKSKTGDLPELICKSPRDVIEGFVAGCIEGDGCVSGNRIRLISGSEKFAIRLKKLIRSLGIRSSYHISKSKEHITKLGHKFKGSHCFVIRIGQWHKMSDRMLFKKVKKTYQSNNFASKIQNITKVQYDGLMYDFTVADNNNYVANGMIVSNTHCAGTAVGRNGLSPAPGANLIVAKVMNDRGEGATNWINSGREWAAKEGADIISESLGGPVGSRADIDSLERCYRAGANICIAAAGNSGFRGPNTIGYPARYLQTCCVGAYDINYMITSFSSGGREMDVACPGQNIISASHRGGYVSLNGTSMACPFMAGIMALVIQKRRMAGYPDISNMDEWRVFFNTQGFFRDLDVPGVDQRSGLGSPMIANILNWLKEPINF